MADSLLETLLSLKVDATEAARAVAAVAKVENAMDDLRVATAKQDAAAKRSTATLKEQVKAARNAADEFDRVSKNVALAGDVQSNLGALRGITGLAGASGLSGGIGAAGELVALAEELPRLKAALAGMPDVARSAAAALGPGGIGLGAVLIGLGVAAALIVRQNQDAIDKLNERIAKEYEYNEITARLTQQQIQDQITAKQKEVEVAQANLEDQRRISAEAIQNVLDTSSSIELGIRGILNIFQPDEATAAAKAYTEAQSALDKLNSDIENLELAMNDADVVARSAAEAERLLALERQKLVDQLADVQISTLLKVNSLSEEAANKRLAEIRLEIETLQRFIDSGTLSAEKVTELSTRITKLGQEAVTLNVELLPLIQAREREAAAIAYQKQQIEDTAAAVEKYNTDIASIEQKNLEARAAASERYYDRTIAIAEAAAQAAENALRQLEQRRAELARDLGRANEDAERQRQQDELDALIAFQREEAKAARDHVNELKRIRRQALRDETQAIQDRDAVALDAAQTRKRDEIQDANDNYQDAARERRIAFSQESADRRVAFERERQDRLIKYQRDIADAQAAYAQELALAAQKRQQELIRAQQAYQQDLATINQKYNAELTARRNAAVAELRMIQQTESQRVTIMAQAQQALLNQARALLAAAGASAASAIPLAGGGGAGAHLSPPSLARGGTITRDGLIYAHKGEEIRNPRRGQTGGSSIVLNINGAQGQEIEVKSMQQALKVVTQAFERFSA